MTTERRLKKDEKITVENGKGQKTDIPVLTILKPLTAQPKIKVNNPIHRSKAIFFPLEKLMTAGFVKIETNVPKFKT